MKCNACGSINLIEGTVLSASGSSAAYVFESHDKPLLKRIFGVGGRGIHSYACIHCNNLQFAVDFNEEDKQKYLEFENQPSSVTADRPDEDSSTLGEKLEIGE